MKWVVFFIILVVPLYGAFEYGGYSAKAMALGESVVAYLDEPGAVFYNPALLYFSPKFIASINYNSGIISEINGGFIGLVKGFGKSGSGALSYTRWGTTDYAEQRIIASYSKRFLKTLIAGINLKYLNLTIQDDSRGTLAGDIGLLVLLPSHLNIGVMIKNINVPQIEGLEDSDIDRVVSIGVHYKPYEVLDIYFNLYKSLNYDFDIRFGAQYYILKRLAIRSGISGDSGMFSFGFGTYYNTIKLDYAFKTDFGIGYSHIVTVSYQLGKIRSVGEIPLIVKRKKAKKKKVWDGTPININEATAEEISMIKGIGPKTAEAIVKYREEMGPFKRLEDLTNVKRIGPKTLEKIKKYITLGDLSKYVKPKIGASAQGFNINEAQLNDFMKIGIALTDARKIILFRQKIGGFTSLKQLSRVPGIKPDTIKKLYNIYNYNENEENIKKEIEKDSGE